MSAPENSIPVEVLDAAINAWFGTVPESKDQQEFFRNRMRAALAAAGYPTAPADGDARDLTELNADLIDILGRPNFTCIRIAQLLRLGGVEIAKKAEAEQATAIHYLLGFYLKHGSQWAEKADEDIERRRLAALAASQQQEG